MKSSKFTRRNGGSPSSSMMRSSPSEQDKLKTSKNYEDICWEIKRQFEADLQPGADNKVDMHRALANRKKAIEDEIRKQYQEFSEKFSKHTTDVINFNFRMKIYNGAKNIVDLSATDLMKFLGEIEQEMPISFPASQKAHFLLMQVSQSVNEMFDRIYEYSLKKDKSFFEKAENEIQTTIESKIGLNITGKIDTKILDIHRAESQEDKLREAGLAELACREYLEAADKILEGLRYLLEGKQKDAKNKLDEKKFEVIATQLKAEIDRIGKEVNAKLDQINQINELKKNKSGSSVERTDTVSNLIAYLDAGKRFEGMIQREKGAPRADRRSAMFTGGKQPLRRGVPVAKPLSISVESRTSDSQISGLLNSERSLTPPPGLSFKQARPNNGVSDKPVPQRSTSAKMPRGGDNIMLADRRMSGYTGEGSSAVQSTVISFEQTRPQRPTRSTSEKMNRGDDNITLPERRMSASTGERSSAERMTGEGSSTDKLVVSARIPRLPKAASINDKMKGKGKEKEDKSTEASNIASPVDTNTQQIPPALPTRPTPPKKPAPVVRRQLPTRPGAFPKKPVPKRPFDHQPLSKVTERPLSDLSQAASALDFDFDAVEALPGKERGEQYRAVARDTSLVMDDMLKIVTEGTDLEGSPSLVRSHSERERSLSDYLGDGGAEISSTSQHGGRMASSSNPSDVELDNKKLRKTQSAKLPKKSNDVVETARKDVRSDTSKKKGRWFGSISSSKNKEATDIATTESLSGTYDNSNNVLVAGANAAYGSESAGSSSYKDSNNRQGSFFGSLRSGSKKRDDVRGLFQKPSVDKYKYISNDEYKDLSSEDKSLIKELSKGTQASNPLFKVKKNQDTYNDLRKYYGLENDNISEDSLKKLKTDYDVKKFRRHFSIKEQDITEHHLSVNKHFMQKYPEHIKNVMDKIDSDIEQLRALLDKYHGKQDGEIPEAHLERINVLSKAYTKASIEIRDEIDQLRYLLEEYYGKQDAEIPEADLESINVLSKAYPKAAKEIRKDINQFRGLLEEYHGKKDADIPADALARINVLSKVCPKTFYEINKLRYLLEEYHSKKDVEIPAADLESINVLSKVYPKAAKEIRDDIEQLRALLEKYHGKKDADIPADALARINALPKVAKEIRDEITERKHFEMIFGLYHGVAGSIAEEHAETMAVFMQKYPEVAKDVKEKITKQKEVEKLLKRYCGKKADMPAKDKGIIEEFSKKYPEEYKQVRKQVRDQKDSLQTDVKGFCRAYVKHESLVYSLRKEKNSKDERTEAKLQAAMNVIIDFSSEYPNTAEKIIEQLKPKIKAKLEKKKASTDEFTVKPKGQQDVIDGKGKPVFDSKGKPYVENGYINPLRGNEGLAKFIGEQKEKKWVDSVLARLPKKGKDEQQGIAGPSSSYAAKHSKSSPAEGSGSSSRGK